MQRQTTTTVTFQATQQTRDIQQFWFNAGPAEAKNVQFLPLINFLLYFFPKVYIFHFETANSAHTREIAHESETISL